MPYITVTKTEVLNAGFVEFARPAIIKWSISGTKPNTRMYPFYDGVPVSMHVTPAGGVLGGAVTTDASGSASGTFNLPGGTFGTGKKTFRFQDTTVPSVPGSTVCSAEAIYDTIGIKKTSQVINKTVWVPPVDPLAQSFFTYGVTGGIYITKIDVYFQTKDTSIPVMLEVRRLVNGLPTDRMIAPGARVIVDPFNVMVSQNASLPTSFVFDAPLYLPENGDYCFVLMTNCSSYNAWVSRVGETSIEDGKLIVDQPYIGSLFKSENNKTWTPDQFEDIKFTIYRAEFNTNVGSELVFSGMSPEFIVPGTSVSTVAGSPTITVKLPFPHGLTVSSKVRVQATEILVASVDTCTYNGLTGAQISGAQTVTSIPDKYTFTYSASANATSTGILNRNSTVNSVYITSGGSGYVTAPTVSFSGGGGSGAAGIATIQNGAVTYVTMTNHGTGYTTAPLVTFSGGSGSGAIGIPDMSTALVMVPNIAYDVINPEASMFIPPGTSLKGTLRTTNAAYEGSSSPTYSAGTTVPVEFNKFNELPYHSLIASRENEIARMSSGTSSELRVSMTSNNSNISPVFDLSNAFHARVLSYKVNNQTAETIGATAKTGSIASITVPSGSGGSGYSGTISMLINGQDPSVYGVVATPTQTGGVINTPVTVTNGGSGFTSIPTITFVGSTGGVGGIGLATLTPFNSEIAPKSGSAESRYLTLPTVLARPSIGARVIVTMYSSVNTNVDIYIRTSLQSELTNHEDKDYTLLSCDQARNLSTSLSDLREYTFYKDGMTPFDVLNLKFVLRTSNPADVPVIHKCRTIILST